MRGWAWQRREAARSPGARLTRTFSFFLPGAPLGRATPSDITIARVLPARAPPTNVARVASGPRLTPFMSAAAAGEGGLGWLRVLRLGAVALRHRVPALRPRHPPLLVRPPTDLAVAP